MLKCTLLKESICSGSTTTTAFATAASAAGCAANVNTQAQQNVVLTNLLQQLANGIPGIHGRPTLPLVPPPIIHCKPKYGITVIQNRAFFEVKLEFLPIQVRALREEKIEIPLDFMEYGEGNIYCIISNIKKLSPLVTYKVLLQQISNKPANL